MKTYKISEFKKHLFIQKMNKISKKAKKLGIDFGYKLSGYDTESVKTKSGKELFYDVYTFDVWGESPTINGFTFLAKIEPFAEGKNLVHTHNTEMDFSEYRDTQELTCEHCNRNRYRKFYYVIGDGENVKVVGHNCLANYIEIPNADKIADFYASFIVDQYTFLEEDVRDYTERSVMQEYYFPVYEFLAYVNAVVEKHGYVSAKDENAEIGKISTRSRAMNEWYYEGKDPYKPSPEELETSKEMLQEVYGMLCEDTNANDYKRNLITLIESGLMKHNHMGYVASIAPLYYSMVSDKVKKENTAPSQHMWEVKEKVENIPASVTAIVPFEGMYGVGYVYKFDVDGNIVVWFSSKNADIEIGEEVIIKKATVKGHDIWQGNKQTLVKLVKFEQNTEEKDN